METNQGRLTARLKEVRDKFVFFELTIYDPSVAGEMILPYAEFVNFLREQNVTLVSETEEEYVLKMRLNQKLETLNL